MALPDLPPRFEFRKRDGVAWIAADLDGHGIAFSLRSPYSPLPGDSVLDVGKTSGPPNPAQVEARSAICEALDLDSSRVFLAHQVHGDGLIDLRKSPPAGLGTLSGSRGPMVEADGFLLPPFSPDSSAAIVTADCLPVAIRGNRGVALLHLGWRGLSTDLLESAVEQVEGDDALIGPGIGPCCYEVGPEVASALGVRTESGRTAVDLAAIATRRLTDRGVASAVSTGLCTCCEQDLLFSYRREGEASGRQCTVVFPD